MYESSLLGILRVKHVHNLNLTQLINAAEGALAPKDQQRQSRAVSSRVLAGRHNRRGEFRGVFVRVAATLCTADLFAAASIVFSLLLILFNIFSAGTSF